MSVEALNACLRAFWGFSFGLRKWFPVLKAVLSCSPRAKGNSLHYSTGLSTLTGDLIVFLKASMHTFSSSGTRWNELLLFSEPRQKSDVRVASACGSIW